MHGAHLLVEGRKMSKSLGNFFTLRDLLAKAYTGREIRYLLLTAHYRETFNFTLAGLDAAKAALGRIDECVGKLRELASSATTGPDAAFPAKFKEVMDEDLNISGGWGVVFDWVRDTNKRLASGSLTAAEAAAALAAWSRVDGVLGIGAKAEAEAPPELLALLDERQAARKAKDFKRSDAIRDELKSKGWAIEDTPKGPRLKKL
jgi:cysteinyl-tRNA synthetase